MHFCHRRGLHPDPEITLYGNLIPVVNEVKFLGVIFDSKINFISHINQIRKRCMKTLNLLRVVSSMDWGADRQVLLRLYRSLIRSKLDYGCIVYGAARKSYLRRLDVVQNQALRICLGAFRTSPIDSLHVEANEVPICLRREKLSLQYAIKIKSTRNNPVHQTIFDPYYEELYLIKPNTIPPFGLRIKETFEHLCEENSVANSIISETPPWQYPEINVDVSLLKYKKDQDQQVLLNKFKEMKDEYRNHSALYTDGSKTDNFVGAGVVMGDASNKININPTSTVFTAELIAIKAALDTIAQHQNNCFIIYSDSLSALEAIKNKVLDNPIVVDILESICDIEFENKTLVFAWVPSHIGIPGNERADKAAKDAHNEPISVTRIPYSDFKSRIHRHIRNSWQDMWNDCENNKLHAIHPSLGEWSHANRINRREEVVLARARIGHTYFTHSFLLKREDVPYCAACACNLSVKHLLIECDDYSHIRRRHYNVRDLKQLFEEINPNAILQFIKETGLYHRF